MGPKSEIAVSKLYVAAIAGDWQTPVASRSNHRAITAIPLSVYVLPCYEQLGCKIAQCKVLNSSQSKYYECSIEQIILFISSNIVVKPVNFFIAMSIISLCNIISWNLHGAFCERNNPTSN